MSQHNFSIANEAGAAFRSDVNSALQALASQSSGATGPATAYAYQRWADTANAVVKQRNAANSSWLVKQTLDETFVLARSSNTILGLSDIGKTINATSSFTQTLTAAATLGDGWWLDYVNSGTGVITFDPNGAETINGATTLAFGPGESGTIYCNGSSFQIVNRSRYAGAIASGRNIAARTNSVTPNTKLDITADELQLKDANGNVRVVTSVSGTIDFGTTGANGLDTSTQAVSTWYYGWVIAKEDGTVALLGSTSSSAPTMPSGYTFKALVTAARSNGSTAFVKYRQLGNEVFYEAQQQVVTAGTATVETAVTITGQVPPNALSFWGFGLSRGAATAIGQLDNIALRVVSGTTSKDIGNIATAAVENRQQDSFLLPNLSQTLFYLFSVAQFGTSHLADLFITGFKLPVGGE